MPTGTRCKIKIALSAELASKFASLLQQGFQHPITAPVSIRDFLVALPGFSREYIETEVQTIFHNGVATDSLDDLLYPGDTLALSAAMPGLAGAIFRRAGMHASLRAKIKETQHGESGHAGFVLVKLYNKIGADRVVDVMLDGARISSRAVANFMKRREDLFANPMQISHDGKRISTDQLLNLLSTEQQVELTFVVES